MARYIIMSVNYINCNCSYLMISEEVKEEVGGKDTKQRRIERYKEKEKCKRKTNKRAISLHIHQTIDSPAVFLIKDKISLLQEYNIFSVTVKYFSWDLPQNFLRSFQTNVHKKRSISFIWPFLFSKIIPYNLVEFRNTGFPYSCFFFCLLSPSVYIRISWEEKSLGDLRSPEVISTTSPAGPFSWF